MMKKQLVMIILSIVLAIGSSGIAFADTAVTTSAEASFLDMPDNWSTAALNKAVSNQLLKGYAEEEGMLIKADNPLTRAEMAAVVNRAFASEAVADISKVTDVASSAWYAKDMAKAAKMGTFALDTVMRPDDKITRQEAFAVLARAFKLTGTDTKYQALDKFSDKADIAAWALKDLDGLAAAGYIQGSDGKLNPKANITRAEFAVVMDNLVKQYIDEAATLSEVTASGNVMIRVPGVTLKNVTVKGDLIIADGVGKGNATLDNVKVEGRTVVRGGGENSIIIKGNSDLGKVIVSKVDGKVRISVEGNADVEIIYVDDGSDDVFVEGTFGTVEVAGDNVTVTATKATLTSGVVSGDNSKIIVGSGSTIKDGVVSGKSSGITVNKGATVDKVTITGSNAKIEGDGTVKNTEVKSGGDNASITTPDTVISVGAGVSGTTAAGGASVPAGSTATNNATGTGSQVTDLPQSPGGGSDNGPALAPALISLEVGETTGEGTVDDPFIIFDNVDENIVSIRINIGNVENSTRPYKAELTIKNDADTVVATASATTIGYNINTYLNDKSIELGDFDYALSLINDEQSNKGVNQASLLETFNKMVIDKKYSLTVKITPVGFEAKASEETVYLKKVTN